MPRNRDKCPDLSALQSPNAKRVVPSPVLLWHHCRSDLGACLWAYLANSLPRAHLCLRRQQVCRGEGGRHWCPLVSTLPLTMEARQGQVPSAVRGSTLISFSLSSRPLGQFTYFVLTLYLEIILDLEKTWKRTTEFPYTLHSASPMLTSYISIKLWSKLRN